MPLGGAMRTYDLLSWVGLGPACRVAAVLRDVRRKGEGVRVKKAVRLSAILQALQERPHTTRELAERFNVSERTIQQDLQDLRDDPIYAQLVQRVRYEWGLLRKME